MGTKTVQKLRHTRGRTFRVSGRLTQNGTPMDLTDIIITSQLRDGPTLMADCVVEVVNAELGQYSLSVPVEEQAAWPLKALRMDVVYTFASGDVVGTQVFFVDVDNGVTAL